MKTNTSIYGEIVLLTKPLTVAKMLAEMVKDGMDPSEITALFRSKETAEEIRQSVEAELGQNVPDLMVTTFTVLNEDIIAREWQSLGFARKPVRATIAERNKALAETLAGDTDWEKEFAPQNVFYVASAVFSAVRRAKINGTNEIAEARYETMYKYDRTVTMKLVSLYVRYEEILRRKGLLTGGDAIYYAGRFLDSHPGYIETEYGFTHLVTDYKDAINQFEMLKKYDIKHPTFAIDDSTRPI